MIVFYLKQNAARSTSSYDQSEVEISSTINEQSEPITSVSKQSLDSLVKKENANQALTRSFTFKPSKSKSQFKVAANPASFKIPTEPDTLEPLFEPDPPEAPAEPDEPIVVAPQKEPAKKHGCVYNTIFSIGTSDKNFRYKTPEKMKASIKKALTWMVDQQQQDGGWSAGTFAYGLKKNKTRQKSDAATTALVSMSILRTGSTLTKGPYSDNLDKSLEYLLTTIDDYTTTKKVQHANGLVTYQRAYYTQIQSKLGVHIDPSLSAQFFSTILRHTTHDPNLTSEVKSALNKCVKVLQEHQDTNGSTKGGTWAGILQSSYANNALELAYSSGADMDKAKLDRSREYQMKDPGAKINAGAGILLYSVSGTVKTSSKDVKNVHFALNKAKKNGTLHKKDTVSVDNLKKIGYNHAEAMKQYTAYEVYKAAKSMAMQPHVQRGFGNNGGEEYLSFLQIGEGMITGYDHDWKVWYDNTAGGLLKLQNKDGSWNGSHCITSSVFCTASCILILSVDNDVEELLALK